jgi:NADP-dependent 3-hydroxy acid dehydrogenase YdfG
MNKITGRCIWLTGASSGLGKALAEQLAGAGNFVIVSARSQAELAKLALQYPGKIKILPLDISRKLDLKETATQLREITDYLDMVICAAGICEYEDNLSFNPEMYERTFDVNFLGVVRTLNIALPLLKKAQTRPHFAVISSLSTCVGFPRAEAYGSSKAALNYFMQSLRADFSKIALDLSLVRPGFIATNLVCNAIYDDA